MTAPAETARALGKDAAPAKRKRVVASKPTRSGCKTCRTRRVKCDEARPKCAKCTSSGRRCDGYTTLSPGRTSKSRPLLPASSRSPSTGGDTSSLVSVARSPASLRALTPALPPSTLKFSITDTERHAFDFFRLRMAGPIEIMSPAKGWVQQALQMSTGSKAVFHGIAALSSANLAISSINHITFAALHKPERYTDALDEYSKTIAALYDQIWGVMEGHASLEPVLLTCLLLMCYELHAQRSSMALKHHSMGRSIAKKYLSDRKRGFESPSSSSDPLQMLADAFDKMGVTSLYPGKDQTLKAPANATTGPPHLSTQPLPADSLSCAWRELDQLIDAGKDLLSKLYQFAERQVITTYGRTLDQATHYCLTSCWSRSVQLPLSDTLIHDIWSLLQVQAHWRSRYPILSGPDPDSNRALMLLHIRQWASSFALATCRDTRETCTDLHENDFIRVMDLAELYLQPSADEPRPLRPRSPFGNGQDDDFRFDEGINQALDLVSLKSRTSATRHRAIDILANSYRREGLGSSTITAQIAVAIVRVEENLAKAMTSTSHTDLQSHEVPEEARFADIARAAGSEDVYRPTCRIVCARYLHESSGDIEIVEYLSKGPCYPYSNCAGKCRTGFDFKLSKEKVRYSLFAKA